MKPVQHTWQVQDLDGIALLQNTAGAANLILNGALVDDSQMVPVFKYNGVSRTISLTSANNLGAVMFTITGTYRSIPQSETIAGPVANSVETTVFFDEVTAISTDGAVNAVSAGTGTTGFTSWFKANYNIAFFSCITAVEVIAANITYSYQITYDDIDADTTPFMIAPVGDMTAATTSQISNAVTVNTPFVSSRVLVTASDVTGSLKVTNLQAGII